MVVFPKEPNRKIFLLIVIKEKLLYFDTIYLGELMARLQKKGSPVKVVWCKDSRQVFLLSGRKKIVPK